MQTHILLLIQGYQEWLEQMHADGWSIWFGTVQFHHQGRGKAITADIMRQEVERIYHLLLTNLFRNPRKVANVDLPILIGCPDSQVSKHKPTTRLADMLPNEGMHYHFVLTVPPITRLKVSLNQHVEQNMHVYLGTHGKVSKFDLQPFKRIRGQRTADYPFKHIKRGTYTTDDILILPGGLGDIQTGPKAVRAHPSPAELRAGFRGLLALYKDNLLRGKMIEVRSPGSVGPALLSILPHAAAVAPTTARGKTNTGTLQLGNAGLTLCSATLVVPGAGERTTGVGKPRLVMRDLEAVFNEMVVRDRQFQTTPKFADIAASLAPLVGGEYEVVISRPKLV